MRSLPISSKPLAFWDPSEFAGSNIPPVFSPGDLALWCQVWAASLPTQVKLNASPVRRKQKAGPIEREGVGWMCNRGLRKRPQALIVWFHLPFCKLPGQECGGGGGEQQGWGCPWCVATWGPWWFLCLDHSFSAQSTYLLWTLLAILSVSPALSSSSSRMFQNPITAKCPELRSREDFR